MRVRAGVNELRAKPKGPVRASELQSRPVKRFKATPAWSEALSANGEGVACPSTVLVYGAPGTGKTTHLTHAAIVMAESMNGDALLVTAEQESTHAHALVERVAGKALDRLLVWGLEDDAVTKIESVVEVVERASPRVVVFDSIHAFTCAGVHDAYAVATAIVKFNRRMRGVCFLVSQVNKEGRERGSSQVPHLVDSVVRMTPRSLWVKKSRFGPRKRVAWSDTEGK